MITAALSKWVDTIAKGLSGYTLEESSDLGENVTSSLIGQSKRALDTRSYKLVDISGSDQTVLAVSKDRIIQATGAFTNAKRGSVVRFVTGENAYEEVDILKRIDANNAILSNKQDVAYAVGDTFRVYKKSTEVISSTGGVNATITAQTKAPVNFTVQSLSGVTESAYTEIESTVGATAIKQVEIFMSSGTPLYLAFGAAGSEVDKLIIIPGGRDVYDLDIPAGTRLAIKATAAPSEAFTTEQLIINYFG